MASRIRKPFQHKPKHRADRKASKVGLPLDFTPRHCVGQGTLDGCMHSHPGETPLSVHLPWLRNDGAA